MVHFILMSEIKHFGTSNKLKAEKDLKNVISVINKIHKKNLITALDMMFSHEFQGITNSLQGSIELLFDIEECIIENNLDFKLKYVLYHDTLKTIQSKHLAYERLGFGLIDARDMLHALKKTDSRFLVSINNSKKSMNLNNLFLIYEDYIDSWKQKDFESVTAFLNNQSYKDVAKQFNINVSSGWRREKNLKMKQYYTIKEMILNEL